MVAYYSSDRVYTYAWSVGASVIVSTCLLGRVFAVIMRVHSRVLRFVNEFMAVRVGQGTRVCLTAWLSVIRAGAPSHCFPSRCTGPKVFIQSSFAFVYPYDILVRRPVSKSSYES